MRLERDTFGLVLRAARERRGISLQQLSSETKVSVELWSDLEDNDFSRWPERIYARNYIRNYATHVGLDPEVIVDEFCRLYPEQGDRRAEGLLRAHAEIVQHELEWQEESSGTTIKYNRRATDRAPADGGFMGRHANRFVAIGLDVTATAFLAMPVVIFGVSFWPALGVVALVYHSAGVFVTGRTFGGPLSERCMKLFRALPARRLVSSRVGSSIFQ
jgi:transcriptional regulator with XRE-family HTH domain